MQIVRRLITLVLVAAAGLWVANTPDDFVLGPAALSSDIYEDIYDPVRAGEVAPDGFRQLLPRDAIFPVYEPAFRSADSTDWLAETLVIGVELDGEAKAYPVTFLNRREMVNDWIGSSPVLVTW